MANNLPAIAAAFFVLLLLLCYKAVLWLFGVILVPDDSRAISPWHAAVRRKD